MKNKLRNMLAIGMALILASSMLGLIITLVENSQLSYQLDELSNRVASASDRVEVLENRLELARENDQNIYLEDPFNFIANGAISLGEGAEVVETYSVIHMDGSESTRSRYRLAAPGFVTAAGWFPLEAVKGETVHLMLTRENDGPAYIGYYTCYTNSSHCTVTVKETGIPAQVIHENP